MPPHGTSSVLVTGSGDDDRISRMLDASLYTDRRVHPTVPCWIELVAYERRDGVWDLFAFEPAGVCPSSWEADRVDAQHIRLGELASSHQLNQAVELVHAQLGPGYEPVMAYREEQLDQRVGANRRLQYLHKAGATGYSLRRGRDGHFELWARRKDLAILAAVAG
jgi:hypothetical protein